MRKHIQYIFAPIVVAFLFSACVKDKGNYDYYQINQLSFNGVDTIKGYTVSLGENLEVISAVTGTLDGGKGNYTYKWSYLNSNNQETLVSTERNLNMSVDLKPGRYSFVLRVHDESNQVTWLKQFPVTVITTFYEGYLVLNEVSGKPRLDFLGYMNDEFSITTDLLNRMGTTLPDNSRPLQIQYSKSTQMGDYVYLLTESSTSRLDPETFEYKPSYDIKNQFMDLPPTGFRAQKMLINGRAPGMGNDYVYLYDNGNMYNDNRGFFQYALKLNRYSYNFENFRISPFVVGDSYLAITTVGYNETQKRFVNIYANGCEDIEDMYNFPVGYDLIYMGSNGLNEMEGNAYAYAVLKDPASSQRRIIRFAFKDFYHTAVDYNDIIQGTDIALAENFCISPEYGYLFYNVAGKLYEYDMFLKQSKLMIDLGSSKINYISFERKTPAELSNLLLVGAFDPAGTEGQNGTLTFYTVPGINANLIEKHKFTGLGKVVSTAFRFR